jgi:hypothetical protein
MPLWPRRTDIPRIPDSGIPRTHLRYSLLHAGADTRFLASGVQELDRIIMNWYFIALALAVASAAALAYYPARRLGGRSRTLAWLASSAVVALSPCLMPLTSNPLRFGGSLIAVTLLVKLYDVYMESWLAQGMSLRTYLAYLPNGFWLVLRRVPSRMPVIRDLKRLACAASASLLSVLVCAGLWR